MRAGRLDQRITLQQQVSPRAVDDMGSLIDSFEVVDTVWAEAVPKGTRAFEQANTQMASIDVVFRIYDHHGVQPEWRIAWNGQKFDVIEYQVDGRNTYGMIHAKSIKR